MSAFLCNPEHIAALAVYAARIVTSDGYGQSRHYVVYPWRSSDGEYKTALNICAKLAAANIASIEYKYPDTTETGNYPGPVFSDSEIAASDYATVYVTACVNYVKTYMAHHKAPASLTALDYYRMSRCFDYQACEIPDYQKSLAARQMSEIREKAFNSLPGADRATWEYEE